MWCGDVVVWWCGGGVVWCGMKSVPFAELSKYETAEANATATALAQAEAREAAAYEAAGKAGEALPPRKRPKPKAYPATRGNQTELSELMVVFPFAARFNHSCWPNVSLLSPSQAHSVVDMLLVTIRSVDTNEQLTISYFEDFVITPKLKRQHRLYSSHHFICDCQRCGPAETDASAAAAEKKTPAPAPAPAPTSTGGGGKNKKKKGGSSGGSSGSGGGGTAPVSGEGDVTAIARGADIALERTVPLIKKKDLTKIESDFAKLKAQSESERTTTGVTASIKALTDWYTTNPIVKCLTPLHALSFQFRSVLWRLLLTFYTAAVAHKDVNSMFTADHRHWITRIIIEELQSYHSLPLPTYDTRNRIFYTASLQFDSLVKWTAKAPPALIKHYTHVCSFFDKIEKPYAAAAPDAAPATVDTSAAPAPATQTTADTKSAAK